jgi:hypothetical protein
MSGLRSASLCVRDLIGTLTGDVIIHEKKGSVRPVTWPYRCRVHSQVTGFDVEATMKGTQGALIHPLQDLAKKVANLPPVITR